MTDLSVLDICQEFSIKLSKQNKAYCPFHEERTPSFKVYPNTNSWYCFGCGKGGDAIRLKALLLRVSDKEILQELNGGGNGYRNTLKAYRRAAQRRKEQAREAKRQQEYNAMCEKYKYLLGVVESRKPRRPGQWDDEWCKAVNQVQACEYWFECFDLEEETRRGKLGN